MKKRRTIQRTLVLDIVRKLQCHATADQVYEEARQVFPSISRATVYRNLQQLCELGEIQKCEIPGSADRYDHITASHYHARCTLCGKVFDVDMEYLEDLTKAVKNTQGFEFTGHTIVFSGICPKCKGEKSD